MADPTLAEAILDCLLHQGHRITVKGPSMRARDPDRALVYMWHWMITDGQRFATDLLYAPLPTDAQNFGLVQLTKITAADKPIIPYLAAG